MRGPYCLPLSICLFYSLCSRVFLFFFLFFSGSTLNHLPSCFFFFASSSLVLLILSLPPSLHAWVNGVSVIKSSGPFCWVYVLVQSPVVCRYLCSLIRRFVCFVCVFLSLYILKP